MFKKILNFFDKFEDGVRHRLSKKPLLYAIIGGIAVVLFWRGVWHLADEFNMSSWASLVVSVVVMLATGTFVSFFIGEQILMSGLREEKRLDEKTEEEIKEEDTRIARIRSEIDEIREDVEVIKSSVAPRRKELHVKREHPAKKIRIRVVKK
jgi:uncharacterized membrane protein YcjF (UPF0283 family)